MGKVRLVHQHHVLEFTAENGAIAHDHVTPQVSALADLAILADDGGPLDAHAGLHRRPFADENVSTVQVNAGPHQPGPLGQVKNVARAVRTSDDLGRLADGPRFQHDAESADRLAALGQVVLEDTCSPCPRRQLAAQPVAGVLADGIQGGHHRVWSPTSSIDPLALKETGVGEGVSLEVEVELRLEPLGHVLASQLLQGHYLLLHHRRILPLLIYSFSFEQKGD